MSSAPKGQVARRRVFYIPGYDPVPARKYREIYRREGAEQARISGYALAVAGLPAGSDPYGWTVQAEMDGARVDARVEVLVWSDIVKASMAHSIAGSYLALARVAWIYIASGALWRLTGLRKGPVIAAFYPVVMMLLYLCAALLVGAGVALVLPGGAVSWIAGAVAFWLVLRGCRALDGHTLVFYLLHLYAYCAQDRGAIPADLSDRLDRFAGLIAEALNDETDEVLLVGHSMGAPLAVLVLADLLRAGRVRAGGPAVGLLTLGQIVPMLSFLPRADRLRGGLRFLSAGDVPWVDVSAPGDGCAFALCDPVAVSGVAPAGKRWPLVLSAAFTQTLSPERWAALRRRFHRLHFQYLCAFDRPGDYDYFRITAGPQTLSERFAGRAPSQSRIETPVSKYTSVAA